MLYAKDRSKWLREEVERTAVVENFADTLFDVPLNALLRHYGNRLRPLTDENDRQLEGAESMVYVLDGIHGSPPRVIKLLRKRLSDTEVVYRNALHHLLLEELDEDQTDFPGYHMRNLPDGTTVVEQEFVSEEERENGFSLYAGHAELKKDLSADAYRHVTQGLIAPSGNFQFDRDEFLHVQGSEPLERTLKATEHIWEVGVLVQQHTRGFIRFLRRRTGALPDFANKENLIETRHDGELHLRTIDGIHPDIDVFSKFPAAARLCSQHAGSANDKRILLATLNTMRLLHGLAEWLKTPDRVDLPPMNIDFGAILLELRTEDKTRTTEPMVA